MSKLIEINTIPITNIDIDEITRTVNRLEKLVEAIEATLEDEPSNENFIEGSKVLSLEEKLKKDVS